jgi:hypothetical protein
MCKYTYNYAYKDILLEPYIMSIVTNLEMQEKIINLEIELQRVNLKNLDLIQRLQKYTNSDGHKKYYEKNKERVKINGSKYLKKLKEENPEKLKEYAHRAYINRKEKLFKEKLLKETQSNQNKNNVISLK